MEDIAAAVRKFVVQDLMFEKDESILQFDDNLLDGNVLDSMGTLQLAVFLEKEYRISVSSQELLPKHFQNIRSIARLVSRKLAESRV